MQKVSKEISESILKFKFTLIDAGDSDETKCSEEQYYVSIPMKSYEEYFLVKCVYNYASYQYRIHKHNSNDLPFQKIIARLIQVMNTPFWKNKINQKQIKELEEKVDAIEQVKQYLKISFEQKGYTCIQGYILYKNEEYCKLTTAFLKDIINQLKAYLDTDRVLEKAHYTENLDTYFDLIGLKSNKLRLLAQYLFFTRLSIFDETLQPSNTLQKISTYFLNKTYSYQEIIKYSSILFAFENTNGTDSALSLQLLRGVESICFKKYKDKKQLFNVFLPKLKDAELTEKDFDYIPQIKYIKSLLESSITKNKKGINILLYGNPGCGKTALSRVLINSINADGYEVTSKACEIYDPAATKRNEIVNLDNYSRTENFMIMRMILKNNKKGIILYDEAEDFFRKRDNISQAKATINEILEENCVPVIWTTNSLNCMEQSFLRRFTYILNIEEPPLNVYKEIFNKLEKEYNLNISDEIKNLYFNYRPNLATIKKTLENYKMSNLNDPENLKNNLLDVLQGQRYGEKVKELKYNKFKFNPELINASEDLINLTNRIKETGRLDFSLLLYGVPGSSKTSFGRYLAEELGLQLICKNYTELSSMWVGETEKNIADLFAEAKKTKALIILDEADVLLQDRTKLRLSWEISQVEALLTEMEDHPYPFIMTTNLYQNLDAAVMRRFLYKVKHDYLTDNQIRLAFKYFFNLDVSKKLRLSKLTSGDFAVVKKQAEFENKLQNEDWLIERLENEMNQKKISEGSQSIKL